MYCITAGENSVTFFKFSSGAVQRCRNYVLICSKVESLTEAKAAYATGVDRFAYSGITALFSSLHVASSAIVAAAANGV
jgi:hypothetical protein